MGFFRDEDHGYKRLTEQVFDFSREEPVVTVGIHEKEGGAEHGLLELIDIACINEFGSDDGHVPSRSFIRAWFDEAEPKLREELIGLMRSVLAGKRTKEEILNILGQVAVGQVQERIARQIPPPNADETIRRKGSSTPLIDTGALRAAITYAVDGLGKHEGDVTSQGNEGDVA
jgi:hypothetical protein